MFAWHFVRWAQEAGAKTADVRVSFDDPNLEEAASRISHEEVVDLRSSLKALSIGPKTRMLLGPLWSSH
jgi:hypothetical protein